MIAVGNNTITEIYVGAVTIKEAYVGDQQVFPSNMYTVRSNCEGGTVYTGTSSSSQTTNRGTINNGVLTFSDNATQLYIKIVGGVPSTTTRTETIYSTDTVTNGDSSTRYADGSSETVYKDYHENNPWVGGIISSLGNARKPYTDTVKSYKYTPTYKFTKYRDVYYDCECKRTYTQTYSSPSVKRCNANSTITMNYVKNNETYEDGPTQCNRYNPSYGNWGSETSELYNEKYEPVAITVTPIDNWLTTNVTPTGSGNTTGWEISIIAAEAPEGTDTREGSMTIKQNNVFKRTIKVEQRYAVAEYVFTIENASSKANASGTIPALTTANSYKKVNNNYTALGMTLDSYDKEKIDSVMYGEPYETPPKYTLSIYFTKNTTSAERTAEIWMKQNTSGKTTKFIAKQNAS